MNVSAIIVTRGNVDLDPIYKFLPPEWETVVWDNSGEYSRGWPEVRVYSAVDGYGDHHLQPTPATDLSVYGRYAAIEYASHDLIYIQDDDVIVSDPQAIVDAWEEHFESLQPPPSEYAIYDHDIAAGDVPFLVANMPQEFRHDFYTEHCLVGFGAAFHRDAPGKAFERFFAGFPARDMMAFNRCCDVVFTALTPRILADVPKQDREFASDPDRMWKQPWHQGERQRMLDLVGSLA